MVDGGLVEAHADDDRPVERGVGPPVAAAAEPVTSGHPGRRGDRAAPTELGEGSVGSDPLGVVPEDDQNFRGGVGADLESVTQGRKGLAGGLGEELVVLADLVVERELAAGQSP